MIIKEISKILLAIFAFYLITSIFWSVLNIQLCTSDLPKNPNCEQIAENNSKNCRYIILKWKKVDYSKELEKCREWERKQ